MPSVSSLQKQQYYGHPRNAFWPLMAELLGFGLSTDYAKNIEEVKARGIALWDVIGECKRPGSLDSAIVKGSERINPIPEWLAGQAGVTRIGLNGGTAGNLFKRHVLPKLNTDRLTLFKLPSTSPANARMNFEAKCKAWHPLFK